MIIDTLEFFLAWCNRTWWREHKGHTVMSVIFKTIWRSSKHRKATSLKMLERCNYFSTRDWLLVQQRIREHQDFDRWWVVIVMMIFMIAMMMMMSGSWSTQRTRLGWKPISLMATPLNTGDQLSPLSLSSSSPSWLLSPSSIFSFGVFHLAFLPAAATGVFV